MGVPDHLAHASIRFGLGRFNTEEEVDHAVRLFVAQVKRLRELAPELNAPEKASSAPAGVGR
jgi:cysteine desulfurase